MTISERLGKGVHEKLIEGRDCLKSGWGLDCLLIYGGLGKKEGGGVFEGGLDPNMHYGTY